MSPVKSKKPSKRASKAKKIDIKEPSKEWTTSEEIALCKSLCDVSGNSDKGNTMKSKGFWQTVINYFRSKTGSTRGYDLIVSKWKNRVRPTIGGFCAIINSIEQNHEIGLCDLTVTPPNRAWTEYVSGSPCWNILKEHALRKDMKMPDFYKKTKGQKKSKTSETNSGSAQGGLNLNDEAV
ncbi:hypothetical protein Tco_0080157 [Tanacetum coccineum]